MAVIDLKPFFEISTALIFSIFYFSLFVFTILLFYKCTELANNFFLFLYTSWTNSLHQILCDKGEVLFLVVVMQLVFVPLHLILNNCLMTFLPVLNMHCTAY